MIKLLYYCLKMPQKCYVDSEYVPVHIKEPITFGWLVVELNPIVTPGTWHFKRNVLLGNLSNVS